jgi:hypothetical protein
MANSSGTSTTNRSWSGDDIFVAAIACLGFGSAIFLPIRFTIPPIVISILLATGIAALAYRFLGGVSGASITVGAAKLTGAVAVLVGVATFIHADLVKEVDFRLITDDAIVGPWKWVYARGGASGHIYISKDADGNLTWEGEMEKYSDEKTHVPLYTVKNGKAKLINRNSLTMEADVEDYVNKDHFHWKADAPLMLLPAFRGSMRATRDDGSVITDTWGIMFYKQSGE